MGDLTREQELALVEALKSDGQLDADTPNGHLLESLEPGLVEMDGDESGWFACLTPAGRICAQLIKERDEARAAMGPNGVPPLPEESR